MDEYDEELLSSVYNIDDVQWGSIFFIMTKDRITLAACVSLVLSTLLSLVCFIPFCISNRCETCTHAYCFRICGFIASIALILIAVVFVSIYMDDQHEMASNSKNKSALTALISVLILIGISRFLYEAHLLFRFFKNKSWGKNNFDYSDVIRHIVYRVLSRNGIFTWLIKLLVFAIVAHSLIFILLIGLVNAAALQSISLYNPPPETNMFPREVNKSDYSG